MLYSHTREGAVHCATIIPTACTLWGMGPLSLVKSLPKISCICLPAYFPLRFDMASVYNVALLLLSSMGVDCHSIFSLG